jgi:hypothetical protein
MSRYNFGYVKPDKYRPPGMKRIFDCLKVTAEARLDQDKTTIQERLEQEQEEEQEKASCIRN